MSWKIMLVCSFVVVHHYFVNREVQGQAAGIGLLCVIYSTELRMGFFVQNPQHPSAFKFKPG